MMILFYSKVKFGAFWFCMGKCIKAVDFQETIEVCEMKVGTYSQINE